MHLPSLFSALLRLRRCRLSRSADWAGAKPAAQRLLDFSHHAVRGQWTAAAERQPQGRHVVFRFRSQELLPPPIRLTQGPPRRQVQPLGRGNIADMSGRAGPRKLPRQSHPPRADGVALDVQAGPLRVRRFQRRRVETVLSEVAAILRLRCAGGGRRGVCRGGRGCLRSP